MKGKYSNFLFVFLQLAHHLVTTRFTFLLRPKLEIFFRWVEARNPKDPIIPFSAELENKLFDMSPEEAAAYCTENKTRTMLARIIKMGYSRLRLMSFFTVGKPEVRAWTIHAGMKAPQAAGTIHTDFEKKFICAEVMSYADLKEAGSEAVVRSSGKIHTKGKEYVMQDGDVVVFKHNAGGGK